MKKTISFIVLSILSFCGMATENTRLTESTVEISPVRQNQEITGSFTDPNFRQALYDKGIVANPERIFLHEVEHLTTLDLRDSKQKIRSLAGIEHFQELRNLDCSDQSLSKIDLSRNKNIESLNCKRQFHYLPDGGRYHSLNSILLPDQYDPSTKAKFKALDCSYNNGYGFHMIARLPWLERLNCSQEVSTGHRRPPYIDFDTTGNIYLKELICIGCRLTKLNLANYEDLEILACSANKLDTIDISHNKKLKILRCRYQWHNIKDSYFTFNSTVIYSRCPENNLSLEELDCNENGIENFDFSRYPNLRVLDCSMNKFAELDLSKNYKLERIVCNTQTTGKNHIYAHPYERSILHGDTLTSLVLPSENNIKTIICHGNKLEALDLTNCPHLDTLICAGNKIKSLDLTSCPELSYLYCSDAGLEHLNIDHCERLTFLNCMGNTELTALNVAHCRNLETLECSYSKISSLDLSNNTKLTVLYCRMQTHWATHSDGGRIGALTSLTLPQMPDNRLTEILCDNNQINTLDISRNRRLVKINCKLNKLKQLDVSQNQLLTDINCGFNYIQELDFSNNIHLEKLDCGYQGYQWLRMETDKIFYLNELTLPYKSIGQKLKVLNYNASRLNHPIRHEELTTLEELECSDNRLTSINLQHNRELQKLNISHNRLKSINLKKNTALTYLDCEENRFHKIDVSNNKSLNRVIYTRFEDSCKRFIIKVKPDYVDGSINLYPRYNNKLPENLIIQVSKKENTNLPSIDRKKLTN